MRRPARIAALVSGFLAAVLCVAVWPARKPARAVIEIVGIVREEVRGRTTIRVAVAAPMRFACQDRQYFDGGAYVRVSLGDGAMKRWYCRADVAP